MFKVPIFICMCLFTVPLWALAPSQVLPNLMEETDAVGVIKTALKDNNPQMLGTLFEYYQDKSEMPCELARHALSGFKDTGLAMSDEDISALEKLKLSFEPDGDNPQRFVQDLISELTGVQTEGLTFLRHSVQLYSLDYSLSKKNRLRHAKDVLGMLGSDPGFQHSHFYRRWLRLAEFIDDPTNKLNAGERKALQKAKKQLGQALYFHYTLSFLQVLDTLEISVFKTWVEKLKNQWIDVLLNSESDEHCAVLPFSSYDRHLKLQKNFAGKTVLTVYRSTWRDKSDYYPNTYAIPQNQLRRYLEDVFSQLLLYKQDYTGYSGWNSWVMFKPKVVSLQESISVREARSLNSRPFSYKWLLAGVLGSDVRKKFEKWEKAKEREVLEKEPGYDYWVAIQKGDLGAVSNLLETEDFDIERVDDFGRTGLDMAAFYGHWSLVHLFVTKGAKPFREGVKSFIEHAASQGHRHVLKPFLTLEKTNKIFGGKVTDDTWEKLLSEEQVSKLLSQAIELNDLGMFQMIAEVTKHNLDTVVDAGSGETLIFKAVHCNSEEIFKYLLGKGVRTDRVLTNGRNLLAHAAFASNNELFERLWNLGLRAPALLQEGTTLLHIAIADGNDWLVKFLLEKQVCWVNERNSYKFTPLMDAAGDGQEAIVEMLLEHGADKKLFHMNGWSALAFARKDGQKHVFSLLDPDKKAEKWLKLYQAFKDGDVYQARELYDDFSRCGKTNDIADGRVEFYSLRLAYNDLFQKFDSVRGKINESLEKVSWKPMKNLGVDPLTAVCNALSELASDDSVDSEVKKFLELLVLFIKFYRIDLEQNPAFKEQSIKVSNGFSYSSFPPHQLQYVLNLLKGLGDLASQEITHIEKAQERALYDDIAVLFKSMDLSPKFILGFSEATAGLLKEDIEQLKAGQHLVLPVTLQGHFVCIKVLAQDDSHYEVAVYNRGGYSKDHQIEFDEQNHRKLIYPFVARDVPLKALQTCIDQIYIQGNLRLLGSKDNTFVSLVYNPLRDYRDKGQEKTYIARSQQIVGDCASKSVMQYVQQHLTEEQFEALTKADEEMMQKVSDDTHSLLFAATRGDDDSVRSILERNQNDRGFVNRCTENGYTAAMLAAMHGRVAVLEVLAEYGANVHEFNRYKQTAYMLAVKYDQVGVVQYFEETYEDMRQKSGYSLHGESPFMLAIQALSGKVLRYLMGTADLDDMLNEKTKSGRTVWESIMASPGTYEFCQQHLPNIDFIDNQKNPITEETSMMLLFAYGDASWFDAVMKKAKLEDDAILGLEDVNSINKRSPFLYLALSTTLSEDEVIRRIDQVLEIDQSVIDQRVEVQRTALLKLLYLSNDRNRVAKYLIERGINFKAEDAHKQTPLWASVLRINTEMCRHLALKGADLHYKDKHGDTPLSRLAHLRSRHTGLTDLYLRKYVFPQLEEALHSKPIKDLSLSMAVSASA